MCGQGEIWNGKKISLIIDHKNGIRDDNRLFNLQILCPNCNATLETHRGKHLKIKNRCQGCGKNVSSKTKYCMVCYKEIKSKQIKYSKTIQRIEKINSITQQCINKTNSTVLLNTIDFSKFGWVKKLSEIINIQPSKVNSFMKKYFSEFYETKCFKKCNDEKVAFVKKSNIIKNKEITEEKRSERKNVILNSNIDFNKRGWLTKVSKLLNINKTVCLKWFKRNMNDFYEQHKIN